MIHDCSVAYKLRTNGDSMSKCTYLGKVHGAQSKITLQFLVAVFGWLAKTSEFHIVKQATTRLPAVPGFRVSGLFSKTFDFPCERKDMNLSLCDFSPRPHIPDN